MPQGKDHVSWYYAAKKDITPTFWERYRTYLMKSQGFNRDVIKAQMFTKTDLAKYMNIRMCLPHVASTGGQKSFAKFAEWAASQWEKGDAGFNEKFFREVVAMAILFKQADRIVKCQPWYNSYKALRKRKTVGGKEIYAYGCAVSISFAFDGGLCVHSVWS